MTRRRLAVLVACLLLLAGCENGSDNGAAPTTTALEEAPAEEAAQPAGDFAEIPRIVDELEASVVAVLTERGEGSGVVWNDEGVVVTNSHVVAGASDVRLAFADGKRVPAEIVATDPLTDLAVLRSDRISAPAAEFAEELPDVGELAIAIGNPLGFENTVTAGIVSGLHRSIPGTAQQSAALVDLIQTDAAISPGNSGGALVDGDGLVIGINVAFIPPEARAVSIGFAIPSPTVVDVVTQLLETGTVQHAFFGIQPAPLTPQIARQFDLPVDRGVVVLAVVAGGPAEQGGIQAGDVIVSIDGEPVDTVEEFLGALRRRSPGDRVTVEVVRDGEPLTTEVTLSDRPEN